MSSTEFSYKAFPSLNGLDAAAAMNMCDDNMETNDRAHYKMAGHLNARLFLFPYGYSSVTDADLASSHLKSACIILCLQNNGHIAHHTHSF